MIKKMSRIALFFAFSVLLSQKSNQRFNKVNHESGFLHANNVKAIVSNDGRFFSTGGPPGFIHPSPVLSNNINNTSSIFASGIWLVGHVDGELRSSVVKYHSEFIPGSYDDYQEDISSESNPDWKIYYHYSDDHIEYLNELLNSDDSKIRMFAEQELIKAETANIEWHENAIKQGASAEPPGDVAIFYICHDGEDRRNHNLKVQMRVTQWAFRSESILNNAIFTKVEYINKNTRPITDAYLAVWTDIDIGLITDDHVGSDKDLKIAYGYNDGDDIEYSESLGLAPPALAVDLLQGPMIDSNGQSLSVVNQANSFFLNTELLDSNQQLPTLDNKYILSPFGVTSEHETGGPPVAYYNVIMGRDFDGDEFHYRLNAIAAGLTNELDSYFIFHGDPEQNTGWLSFDRGEKRMTLNVGPFNFGVSDGSEIFGDPGYQSIVFVTYATFGKTHLNSVTKVKQDNAQIREAFKNGFNGGIVRPIINNLIQTFRLSQNYPNPFNPSTTISVSVLRPSHVKLTIYNLLGQKVKDLLDQFYSNPIDMNIIWDGTNQLGEQVAGGVYFYKLISDRFTETKKMVMIK